MEFIVLLVMLFVTELFYFKIAYKFKIFDKPNKRSSHTKITLRGGGVVFYFAALFYFIYSGYSYPYFFIGLSLLSFVSFLDDLSDVSYRIRLIVQVVGTMLLFLEWEVFHFSWLLLVPAVVLVVGTINAYNFMDGINGLTAWCSLVILFLLDIVNSTHHFVDSNLIYFVICGALVFTFFNFRINAKCFAGDIGSVSMAFIVIFLLGKLVMTTGNFIYVLFLAVYGVETVWTVMRRLVKRENIFKPHRIHLFQILSNEAGANKLFVSFVYGIMQLLIGLSIMEVADLSINQQILFSVILLSIMSFLYLLIKYVLMKSHDIK